MRIFLMTLMTLRCSFGERVKPSKKHRRGKHKGGQRHNKQWKPYHKLNWDERRELEERETIRANQKREKRFASGQPMAPYNTTQFLMDQHPSDQPVFAPPTGGPVNRTVDGGSGGSPDSSDVEYYDSPEDEDIQDIFLAKEFSEAYDNEHAERLQSMSKEELVREYLDIEGKLEEAEKKVKSYQAPVQNGNHNNGGKTNGENRLPSEESIDIREATNLENEIRRLREENHKLQQDNAMLRAHRENFENTAKVAQIS
jgi:protein HEXIM1/2